MIMTAGVCAGVCDVCPLSSLLCRRTRCCSGPRARAYVIIGEKTEYSFRG